MAKLLTFATLGFGFCASSFADGAMVNFYAASPQAINGAVDCASASSLGLNPVVPPGEIATLDLCMEIDPARIGLSGATGVYGGDLDVVGTAGTFGATALTVNNPNGRWSFIAWDGAAGVAPAVFHGMRFLSLNVTVTPASPSDYIGRIGPGFRIASGTFGGPAGGSLFLALPADEAIVADDPHGSVGGAFGWATGGAPNINVTAIGTGPQPFYSDLAGPPAVPADGFFLVDFFENGVRTTGAHGRGISGSVPIISIAPEPTNLILLALTSLALRRRR